MKEIPLSQGKVALVDDCDYERVMEHKWCYMPIYKKSEHYSGYAKRQARHKGKPKTQLLHRFIMGLDFGDKRQVDHISGDGLDNRRANVRICNHNQNQHNRRKVNLTYSSLLKGVSWYKTNSIWRSCISVNHKTIHLGYFTDETEAAREYDKAALKYFGVEFAHLNFPKRLSA